MTKTRLCVDSEQGWHWAEPAEPRACSREPSQISPPLARLMRDSAWLAEPRASHYNGSARLAVTPRWLAEPICVTYISCVSAQSRLNCMLPSQHSQVYRIHELIESCNIQFTRLNDNWQHLYVTLYQETNSMVLPQKSLLRDLMPGFSLPAFSSGFFPQTG